MPLTKQESIKLDYKTAIENIRYKLKDIENLSQCISNYQHYYDIAKINNTLDRDFKDIAKDIRTMKKNIKDSMGVLYDNIPIF